VWCDCIYVCVCAVCASPLCSLCASFQILFFLAGCISLSAVTFLRAVNFTRKNKLLFWNYYFCMQPPQKSQWSWRVMMENKRAGRRVITNFLSARAYMQETEGGMDNLSRFSLLGLCKKMSVEWMDVQRFAVHSRGCIILLHTPQRNWHSAIYMCEKSFCARST